MTIEACSALTYRLRGPLSHCSSATTCERKIEKLLLPDNNKMQSLVLWELWHYRIYFTPHVI